MKNNKNFVTKIGIILSFIFQSIISYDCGGSPYWSGCTDCVDDAKYGTKCATCSNGYFVKPNGQNCAECNVDCKACEGPNADQCTICADGLQRVSPHSDTTACQIACHSSCNTCNGGNNPNTCTSCSNPSQKVNAGGANGAPGPCVTGCPFGMY